MPLVHTFKRKIQMKKIYFLLIALFVAIPNVYSQRTYYQEQLSWLFYDDGTPIYEAFILNLILVWLILGVIYYFIAKRETSKHIIDRFPPEGQKFLYVAFIICFILRAFFLQTGLLLLGRLILAFYISSDAKKLERSKLLWWILSFIEPNVALLVLANTPKLIKAKGELKSSIESIFEEYDDKLHNLESLNQSGVLEGLEYKKKKEALDELYIKKVNTAIDLEHEENDKADMNLILKQLDKAYEDGILTKEEYEVKRKAILDQ